MAISFAGQVAIVTGAGRGLGRSYAAALAARGARVALFDLGDACATVAQEISAAGGEAVPIQADVTDHAQVEAATSGVLARWGRVDVLVNNAGILRDKTFAKMDIADFRRVMDVHVMGSVHCTKAVWTAMREQNYGRIVFATSSSGLYGTFGQANYGAAKAALVGLMNALHLEGERHNIRVNAIMPSAATAMTDGLLAADAAQLLSPEAVTPGLLFLAAPESPSKFILSAGAGSFARVVIRETEGVSLLPDRWTPEELFSHNAHISDVSQSRDVASGFAQAEKLVAGAKRVRQRQNALKT